MEIIEDREYNCIGMLKIAAFHAFHNLLSCRPGRTDFLNTDSVTEMGEHRQQAMEAYLKTKFSVFNRYLANIPNETILVYERGQDVPVPVTRPLGDSIEIVALVLRVMALLAQELEVREQLAFNCIQHIVFAMRVMLRFSPQHLHLHSQLVFPPLTTPCTRLLVPLSFSANVNV